MSEGEITAKKLHKKKKTDGSPVGFQHIKDKNIKIPLNFNCIFLRDFCSAINKTSPFGFTSIAWFLAVVKTVI